MISVDWNWLGRLTWRDGGSVIQTGREWNDLQCKPFQPVALETHKTWGSTPRAPVPSFQGIPDFYFRDSGQESRIWLHAFMLVQQ